MKNGKSGTRGGRAGLLLVLVLSMFAATLAVASPVLAQGVTRCVGERDGLRVTLSFDGSEGSSVQLLRNGSWRSTVTDLDTFTEESPTGTGYALRVRGGGISFDEPCTIDEEGEVGVGPATCRVVPGDPQTLEFSGELGSSVQVRRNDVWVATVTGLSSFEVEEGDGYSSSEVEEGDGYSIRVRGGRFGGDVPCSINPQAPQPQGQVCSIERTGSAVELSFDSNISDNLQLRRDGRWIATVSNTSFFTDTSSVGTIYVLRANLPDGSRDDFVCAESTLQLPEGTGGPVCTVNTEGTLLTFGGDLGVNNQLRRNGRWVANVTSQASSPADGIDGYVLRVRGGTAPGDIACTLTSDAGPVCPAVATEFSVLSHQNGDVVDTSAAGNGMGSFILSGEAPLGTNDVGLFLENEAGFASLEVGECLIEWSIEALVPNTGAVTFDLEANSEFGTESLQLDLDVVAPGADDTLIAPAFALTPQNTDQVIAYDQDTGQLVFSGDVSPELDIGDGLVSAPLDVAPDGYLRIVTAVTFDGTNTIVETRQGGLTEYVRQLDLTLSFGTEELGGPFVFATDDVEGQAGGGGGFSALGNGAFPVLAQQIADGFDFSADLNLDPSFDIDIDIDFARDGCTFCLPSVILNRIFFEAGLDFTAEAAASYTGASLASGRREIGPPLIDVTLGRVIIPLPVGAITINLEAESNAFLQYSVNAVAAVEYEITVGIAAGYEFRGNGTGRGSYVNRSFDGGLDQVELNAGIAAELSVGLEVDLEALLWGQAGFEVEAEPQLEFSAFADAIDRNIPWQVALVVPINGNLEVEVDLGPIEYEREFGDVNFAQISTTLFDGVVFGADEEPGGGDDGGDDGDDGGDQDPGDDEEEAFGNVEGRILDAQTGAGLAGATVQLVDLSVVATAVSGADGSYAFPDVPVGSYSVRSSLPSFINTSEPALVQDGSTDLVNLVMSSQEGGDPRVILAWNSDAPDLDIHVSGPDGEGGRFHAYFSDRSPVGHVELDRDDTNGAGPETVSILNPGGFFVPGEYRVWVHDFSTGDRDIATGGGEITLFDVNDQLATFSAADATGPTALDNDIWDVATFTVDVNGNITGITPIMRIIPNGSATTIPTGGPDDQLDQLDQRAEAIAVQARNNPNVAATRTVGGGVAEINGQSFEYTSQSGIDANQPPTGDFLLEPTDPIFATDRPTDAEYKIMEQVSAEIDSALFADGNRPGLGEVVPDAEGTVAIVVDSPPGAVCDFCRMVLGDFIVRYPNVEIQIRDTVGGVADPIFN